MSIGAGGILTASLMLGLVLGTTAVVAQTPSGTWTDPPARGMAPAPPSGVANAPAREPTSPVAKGSVGQAREEPATEGVAAIRTPESPAPSIARHAAAPEGRRIRRAERARATRVTAAPRLVAQRDRAKPVPRRVVARSFAPRMAAARPDRYASPYAPLPVGRVEGPGDGARTPAFAEGDDRMRRIAAAQAAGYLVVRARSVQLPDGRVVRSYRPYEDEEGSD